METTITNAMQATHNRLVLCQPSYQATKKSSIVPFILCSNGFRHWSRDIMEINSINIIHMNKAINYLSYIPWQRVFYNRSKPERDIYVKYRTIQMQDY